MLVAVGAALLHELVNLPKDHPESRRSGDLCAEAAAGLLRAEAIDPARAAQICACIRDHGFSKGVLPESLAARVLQDADRLDAIGAIGVARCFATCNAMRTPFYSELDPLCREREPDDKRFGLDHFFRKLLRIPDGLHTASAQPDLAYAAAYALAHAAPVDPREPADQALLRLATAADPETRALALVGLTRRKAPAARAHAAFAAALTDPSPWVQVAAVRGLMALADDDAISTTLAWTRTRLDVLADPARAAAAHPVLEALERLATTPVPPGPRPRWRPLMRAAQIEVEALLTRASAPARPLLARASCQLAANVARNPQWIPPLRCASDRDIGPERDVLEAGVLAAGFGGELRLPRLKAFFAAADLQFSLGSDARGRPVIRVTSTRPVESSVLNFLVEVDWGQGRLVREYSALVEAPNTASAPLQPAIDAPVAPTTATLNCLLMFLVSCVRVGGPSGPTERSGLKALPQGMGCGCVHRWFRCGALLPVGA